MSFAEILSEIPRLSFDERQELVRCAIAVDDAELTAEENALPDARMEDFRRQPAAGISLEDCASTWCIGRPVSDSASDRHAAHCGGHLTPAVTTRGMKEEEMMDIADFLHRTLEVREAAAALAKTREESHAFSRKFPLPF